MSSVQAERTVLLSILKLTGDAVTSTDAVKAESKIPESIVRAYLRKFSKRGLVKTWQGHIEATRRQRLMIAAQLVDLGGDSEVVSRSLGWSEFESMIALALENNGFMVMRHFRFSSQGRRREIDLLAAHKPFLILVECKRWSRGKGVSATKKIVEEHLKKTHALIAELPRLKAKAGLQDWDDATLVPVLANLAESQLRFHEDVPIVAVLQLPSFLSELLAYVPSLKHFTTKL